MGEKSIKIPAKPLENCPGMPKYAYSGDAGFDLKSAEEVIIAPGERKVIHCGFSMAIPEGFAGLVIPRSGLAAKHGISVVNAPGLVDSGYRGEISVILLNTDKNESFEISIGDRIAQMMIVPFANAELIETETLDSSERSEKGFGSSGR
ncbi:MAG: dUTP diphosphatase [Coriobacteriia bacterium]|nr:dUTP diphosphatase [Coriobacteriia bacterium]